MKKPFLYFFILLAASACSKKADSPPPPAVPVTVEEVLQCNIPIYIDGIGNMVAYNTVNIQSQVEGELMNILFEDGKPLKKNDLMFVIDPRPYEAALNEAQANLAVNVANLKLAKITADRYALLVNQDYVSRLDWDQYLTNVQVYEAAVKSNQAQVETAKINLSYCYIRAPFDGVTGRHFIDQGNLIQNAGATLVTFNQLDPIYVDFTIPEKDLAKALCYQKEKSLDVEVQVPDHPDKIFCGKLIVVENNVDKNTGMIVLRGLLENKNYELWPGQFARVKLVLYREPEALLIPETALNMGQKGYYVYVVKPDLTAEMRPVTIGQRMKDQVMVIKGVKAKEKVVTNGQLNVRSGSKVEIKNP